MRMPRGAPQRVIETVSIKAPWGVIAGLRWRSPLDGSPRTQTSTTDTTSNNNGSNTAGRRGGNADPTARGRKQGGDDRDASSSSSSSSTTSGQHTNTHHGSSPIIRRVLALHGWLDNANSFVPWMETAAIPDDVELVAIDFPGHGLSSHKFPGFCYTMGDWVRDVYVVAEELKWDSFHLLGHSMGAGVSMLFAASFPEKVESVTFLDGVAPLQSPPVQAVSNLRQSITSWSTLHKKYVESGRPPRAMTKAAAIEKLMEDNPHVTRKSAAILLERGLKHAGGDQYTFSRDIQLRQRSAVMFSFEQVSAFLAALKAPVCMIITEGGIKVQMEYNKKHGETLATTLGKDLFSFHKVPGTHHAHMNNPDEMAGIWATFIDSHRGRSLPSHESEQRQGIPSKL